MGRGRQRAKQRKVARDLKYFSPETDYAALERSLSRSPVLHLLMMPPILRMAIGQSTIRMMYPQQKMIGMNLIGFHRIGDVLVDF